MSNEAFILAGLLIFFAGTVAILVFEIWHSRSRRRDETDS
jgi:hypothetical protein